MCARFAICLLLISGAGGDARLSATALPGLTIQGLAVDPTDALTIYAATSAGIYRSTDGGTVWLKVTPSLTYNYFNAIAIDPNNRCAIYAAVYAAPPGANTNAIVLRSLDCGSTWGIPAGTFSGAVGVSVAVTATTPSTFYYSFYTTGSPGSHSIVRSVSGTQTSNFQFEDGTYVLATDPADPCTIVAGTIFGNVIRSTNCGPMSWSSVGGNLGSKVWAVAVHPTNHDTMLAATTGGLYRKADAASAWTSVMNISPSRVQVVAFESGNPLVAYAGGSNGVVYKSIDGGSTWNTSSTHSSGITALAAAPAPSRAVFAGGDAFITNVGPQASAPGAPTGVTGTAGNGQVSVAFTAPSSNGGAAITSYTVTASPGGATATGAASPIVVTGLTNGTAYTFTVTATNEVGTGAASTASSAVTPATVPGAPTSVVGTRGNGQVSVAFTAPSSTGGSAITGYTVTASPGGATAAGTGSPLVVTGLTNGTAYTFTVTATNAVGTGAASTASSAVTPATVPGAPTGVIATAGDGSAAISFTPPTSNGGLVVTSYIVTAAPGGLIGAGSGSPVTVTGLTNGTPYTFTVAAVNAVGTGTASSPSAAVTPVASTPPSLTVAPATLRFSATKNGAAGALVAQTGAQSVTVTVAGTPVGQWVATANQTWLQLSGGSGTGSGVFSVAIGNPDNVIGGATSLTGSISVTASNTGKTATLAVELVVRQETAGTQAPVGQVDTPAQNATGVQGAIAMTGWVVDDIGVQRVRIYRQCLSFDAQAACQPVLGHSLVFVGDASVISGARPDVEAQYPNNPANTSAGWGFLILSNLLPNIPAGNASGGGVGAFTFYAIATDQEGNEKLLGRTINDSTPTTVTVANDTIAKPFGAIDTPGQGATVSGTLNNFGWALTPDSNTVADGTDILVPTTGTTINVIVDGASVGTATFNLCRGSVGNPVPASALCDDDVSSIFRSGNRYRNLDAGRGPIGLRSIDTRTLSNGLHTIQWGVSDSAGRGEGIGSRYFTVLNSSADTAARQAAEPATRPATDGNLTPVADFEVYGRTGFDVQRALVPVERIDGVPTIRVPEMGRVELQIPGAQRVSLLASGEHREAPVGMAVHGADTVAWSVGPGYLGTYRLRVDRVEDHVLVDVRVVPMAVADEATRMHLDRADVFGSVVVLHGWALDPQAETGAGIGAIHVWARQRGVAEAGPVFLGVANLGILRSDVAAAHGAQFGAAGFRWEGALGAGEWDVTAYVWNVRTARFEDARTVVIVVR